MSHITRFLKRDHMFLDKLVLALCFDVPAMCLNRNYYQTKILGQKLQKQEEKQYLSFTPCATLALAKEHLLPKLPNCSMKDSEWLVANQLAQSNVTLQSRIESDAYYDITDKKGSTQLQTLDVQGRRQTYTKSALGITFALGDFELFGQRPIEAFSFRQIKDSFSSAKDTMLALDKLDVRVLVLRGIPQNDQCNLYADEQAAALRATKDGY